MNTKKNITIQVNISNHKGVLWVIGKVSNVVKIPKKIAAIAMICIAKSRRGIVRNQATAITI